LVIISRQVDRSCHTSSSTNPIEELYQTAGGEDDDGTCLAVPAVNRRGRSEGMGSEDINDSLTTKHLTKPIDEGGERRSGGLAVSLICMILTWIAADVLLAPNPYMTDHSHQTTYFAICDPRPDECPYWTTHSASSGFRVYESFA
jgi:hypothetical protein